MTVIGSNALAGASGQGGGGYEIERSLRFNNSDDSSLSFTPSSAGNRKTWTWSSWVKLNNLGYGNLFANLVNNNYGLYVYWNSGILNISDVSLTGGSGLYTSRVFRDYSSWYHIVIVYDSTQATASDRVKIYVNGLQETLIGVQPTQNVDGYWGAVQTHYIGQQTNNVTAYNLDGYLADIHFIDGQGLAASDFGEYDDNNVWQPKKYSGSYGTNGFHLDFSDNSSNSALGTDSSGNGNNWTSNNLTAQSGQVYSSGSVVGALYSGIHWSDAFDGSLSTGTFTYTTTTSTLTLPSPVSWSSKFEIYALWYGGSVFVNGSDAAPTWNTPASTAAWYDITSIVGSSGTLTTLGVSDGPVAGNYTKIHAIRLDDTILVDSTAKGDVFRDSPTNGDPTNDTGAGGELSGNYATLNPVYPTDINFSDGNLKAIHPSGSSSRAYLSTIGVTSGRWYWEVQTSSVNYTYLGVAENSHSHAAYIGQAGEASTGIELWATGYVGHWHGTIGSGGTAINNFYNEGDVIGLALDLDSIPKTLKFYKADGTLGATHTISSTNTLFPAGAIYQPVANEYHLYNFGARLFSRSAPSGYKALCTANLPDPTIADPSTAFDAKLYVGNGSTQTISGYGFSPDIVYTKGRNRASAANIFDTVRGAAQLLYPDATDAQSNITDSLTAFTSDGFSLGSNSVSNHNTINHVAWVWDAGSSNTTVTSGSYTNTLYNASQTWSTYGTFDNHYGSSYVWSNVFNNHLLYDSTGSMFVNTTTADKWSLTSSISVQSKIKFFTYGPTTVVVNSGLSDETTATSSGSTYHYHEFDFSGNMSSFSVVPATGTSYIYFMGIWIDGKQLVDSATTTPSIASTVRANPSAGVSIVQYTGTMSSGDTVGHGLNHAPSVLLIKNTATHGTPWQMYHTVGGNSWSIEPNEGAQPNTSSSNWYSTDPTSSVFTLGGNANVNASATNSMIAYCFAPVEGFSSFGGFEGHTTALPFVYTGFKPAFLIIKGYDGNHYWAMHDDARDPTNTGDKQYLWMNTNSTESSGYDVDFLANGFKLRNNNGNWNTTGSYLYLAFAANPFKTARAN